MIARVGTFDRLPEDLDEGAVNLLRKTVRATPGYVGGFHLVDPKTRQALSVTVFEDHEALKRAGAALEARCDEKKVGIAADRVEVYDAIPF